MNDSNDNTDELEKNRLIDSICDRFEQEWIAGQSPQIELYLNEVHGSLKQLLLMELVAIELHYRRKKGESFAFAEYQSRFPGLSLDKLILSVDKSIPRGQTVSITPPAGEQPTLDSGGKLPWESRAIYRNVKIGDYRIIEPIAQGGMGVVYKARQISLNRIVALKMILAGELASKQEIDRFYLEARAAAMLDHPGIVPIIEVGEFEGRHFFSMAYVEGASLSSHLSQGPMDPRQAAALVQTITEAIQYAHDHGVIHRDLKPSNILLDLQGNPRVTDFGLAKKVSENGGLTVSGQILGTPSFMPPEQAAGQIDTIGPASDVYALGAVLYSLTTGRPPFQAASSIDTLRQVVEIEPVSPRQLNPSIPLDLETIILKCLEKSVPRRYPSAQTLGEELQRYLQGIPIHARPVSRVEKLWRWCKRQPAIASLSAVAVLLLFGLATGGFWAYFREVSFRNDLQEAFENEKDAKNEAVEAGQKALEASREAEKAAKLADEARRDKEHQAEIAAQERDNAKASEESMRRNLYISDIGRAHEAIESSNYARASTLLDRHRPSANDQPDLRSVDWHLLQNQIVRPKFNWSFRNPVEVISISPDQSLVAVGCTGGRAYVVEIATGIVPENLPLLLDEEHWSTIGFRPDGILVAHGRSGSIKFWDTASGQTIAHKTRHISWQYQDHRIPAAISSDGKWMLGADVGGFLASWNLEKLRPNAIPYVNEGFHVYPNSMPTHFALDYSEFLQASLIDRNRAIDAGHKDNREFQLSRFIDQQLSGYSPVGTGFSIPTLNKLHELGHPVLSLVVKHDRVALGKTNGEIEFVEQTELTDSSRWLKSRTLKKKISSRPIVGIDYINELDCVIAIDSDRCYLLNAVTLEPILSFPSSHSPFCKVLAVGQGLFALGRRDGGVEIWSAIDENKLLEFSSGTSEVTDIEELGDTIVVSNLDGSIGRFPTVQNQRELVVSRGPMGQSYPSPSTMFWLTSNKALTIHHSLGSQLTSFRMADRKLPKKSSVSGSKVQLLTMDVLHPAIYHEQPRSKRLMAVFEREIRLIDIESLEVTKNIEVSTSKVEYPVSRFSLTDGNTLEFSKDSNDTKSPTPSRQLIILAADDFPDENRVVLAIGNFNEQSGRQPLRLLIRDLKDDRILSDISFEGTQVAPSTFQLIAVNNDCILLDGVLLVGDPNREHTLVLDQAAGTVHVIDSRNVDAAEAKGEIQPFRQHFRSTDPQESIAILSPSEIRLFDVRDKIKVSRCPAPSNQTFEFVHQSPAGDIFAVLKLPTSFVWAKWDKHSRNWDSLWASQFEKNQSAFLTYQWCFDPDRSILYYLSYSSEVKRWMTRSGKQLPNLHLPETKVLNVMADGASIVALGEMKSPGSPMLQQPPWSTSWFRPELTEHELIPSSLYDKRPPFFLPLKKDGDLWLTSGGLRANFKGRSPSETLSIEGKKSPWAPSDFQGSQLLLSDDLRVLVEVKRDAIESWQLSNTSPDEFPLRYVSQGRHSVPWPTPNKGASGGLSGFPGQNINPLSLNLNQPISSVSRQGKLLVVMTNESVYYSVTPFREWKTIDPSIVKPSNVTVLACAANEAAILFGQKNGDIVELQIEDLSLVRYPKGHQGPVKALLSMPDGKSLVSAGEDGKIVIWDVRQKEVRLSLAAHRGAINTLYWNSHTEELLSGGEDGFVRTWPAVSNVHITDQVNAQFRAPNPSEPWTEIKSQPDPKVQFHSDMAAELRKREIPFAILNFGMRVLSYGALSSYDQLAIDSIEITPASDMRGFDFERLAKFPELRFVKIQHPEVTSQEISKLSAISSLYSLRVIGINLGELQLDQFSDTKNLRILELSDCHINDSQTKLIADRFPELNELTLASNALTDVAAESISKLVRLEKLNLSGTSISDASAPWLTSLKRIVELDIGGTAFTLEGLTQLRDLKILHSLAIRRLALDPQELSGLWSRLRAIDVRDTLATAPSIRKLLERGISSISVSPSAYEGIPEAQILVQLGKLPSELEVDGKSEKILKALDRLEQGGSITSLLWPSEDSKWSGSVALLNSLPKMHTLKISKHATPDQHIPQLENLTQITRLDISELPLTTEKQFAMLCKIPNVESVKTKKLTNDTLKKLVGLPNLRSLEYAEGEDLSVVGISLPNLKHIQCKAEINATKLSKVAATMSQLESVTTSVAPSESLMKALAKLPSLKSLHFQQNLSDKEIAALKLNLPNVSLQHGK